VQRPTGSAAGATGFVSDLAVPIVVSPLDAVGVLHVVAVLVFGHAIPAQSFEHLR
jgi:hypothetical protein